MTDLRGGLVAPNFWENGLSDLLKVAQQSGFPTVCQSHIRTCAGVLGQCSEVPERVA